MNSIQANRKHLWRAPHAVNIGPNLARPQQWTITVTSDVGDYRLDGSAAGADGVGKSLAAVRQPLGADWARSQLLAFRGASRKRTSPPNTAS